MQCIDIHLLKPARFRASVPDVLLHNEDLNPSDEWVSYPYRIAHPILRWLPSKLAEWIGDNFSQSLNIAPKANADKWDVGELNDILENNLVAGATGHLRTFGCIEWECELFNGRPKARCYPFDMPKCRFRSTNPQVFFYWLLVFE